MPATSLDSGHPGLRNLKIGCAEGWDKLSTGVSQKLGELAPTFSRGAEASSAAIRVIEKGSIVIVVNDCGVAGGCRIIAAHYGKAAGREGRAYGKIQEGRGCKDEAILRRIEVNNAVHP